MLFLPSGEARFEQLLDEITASNQHIGMNLLFVSYLCQM